MTFKILQWNIKGYFNNYHELELLIRDTKPNVICLQETHIPYSKNNNVIIPKTYSGYFSNNNNTSKQGVATLVRRDCPHKLLPSNHPIQSVTINIKLPPTFAIINSYIPPTQKISETEMSSLLSQCPSPLIFLGDFNAWSPFWGSPNSNTRGTTIENTIIAKNLIVLNDGSPTHFSTHHSFTHIDLTLVDPYLSPRCNWKTLPHLHGSDHYPILIEVQTNVGQCKLTRSPKFKTNAANWHLYQSLCEKGIKDWNTNNVHQYAANITKAIKSAANIAIPQSNITPLRRYSAWWNKELNTLRTRKQTLWHAYKSTPSIPLLIEYKKANALFRKNVKNAKIKSIGEFTSDINPSSSPKKIWAKIKALTGIPPAPIPTIQLPNTYLSSASEISNAFGVNWSNYSDDINFPTDFITRKNTTLSQPYSPTRLSHDARSMDMDFTPIELELALQSAKGKTPGRDRISYPMLRNLPNSSKNVLLILYNKIFHTGVYPHTWLSSTILPIPKPNKSGNNINNYRPISLLPCLCKVLEKMITKRIMWYIAKNNLVHPNQVAFKKKHGTLDALLPLQHFISDALSTKNHVSLLSTDFEKAFDRVGAHVVLEQLSSWGIGPNTYAIIKSFLTNRKFQVKANGTFSRTFPLMNGIPQGSPLSVALFTIAFQKLNEIASTHKNMDFRIYADDAFFFTKIKDPREVETLFCNLLQDIHSWGQQSGAILSYDKCKLLHICRKKLCLPPQVNILNIPLENVKSLKILGITFDTKYTYKDHCQILRKNLTTRTNIIKYLSSKHLQIHPNTLVNITRSLILAKIDYGLPIYGFCANSHLRLLYMPYHTAVRRSINAFPTSPIKCILAEAGLPSITERRQAVTLKLIPRLINTTNKPLFNLFKNSSLHKRHHKIMSTIRYCSANCKNLGIQIPKTSPKISCNPPWLLNPESTNTELHNLPKNSTPSAIFQQHFHELLNSRYLCNRTLIFTDGSKSDHCTTFAVVKNDGTLITGGWLPPYSSIYSAEAIAIDKAIEYVLNNKGNFAICTDSYSVIQSVENIFNDSPIISDIRNYLIKYPRKLKIIWTPSHKGIRGNEYADTQAKNMYLSPSISFAPPIPKDLLKHISNHLTQLNKDSWTQFSHHYTTINPECKKPTFASSLTKQQITTFIRLRIGHTQLSHQHLLLGTPPPVCLLCGNHLSPSHILEHCPTLSSKRTSNFGHITPSSLLRNPTIENVTKVSNFLKDINLYGQL